MTQVSQTLHSVRLALQQGQYAAGATLCREVLAGDDANVEARYFLGLSHALGGEVERAINEWERIVALRPADFSTRANLGAALLQLERPTEAIAHLHAALAVDGRHALVHANLGRALHRLGYLDQAAASLERAAALNVQDVDTALECAAVLEQLGQRQQAIACLRRALQAETTSADLHYALANALHRAGVLEAALASYDRALELAPMTAQVLRDRGRLLESLQRLPEALQDFESALGQSPDDASLMAGALSCSVRLCAWSAAAEQAGRLWQSAQGVDSLHPFVALSTAGDPGAQRRCASARAEAASTPITVLQTAPRERGERDQREQSGRQSARRIRVAYVSSDFGDHPVGRLVCSLIEQHDRARFEVLGIALKAEPEPSAVALRLRTAFDDYHEVGALADATVAERLRGWQVDIAVDLNGYTLGGRPGIFAHRGAPIQVNYLGYPGTLGATYIDYLIADEVVVPPGAEDDFVERIARLPHCFLPVDDHRALARVPTRSELDLPEHGVVFCAFTNSYKINPPMFDVWMRLLQAVSGSMLWLRAGHPVTMQNLRLEAQARGVEAERLRFAPPLPDLSAHLARQRCADLYLDTLPYNAHSTTCDALWAGLPVLTCAGQTFAGRVAASALTTIGLPELITHDLRAYEQRAIELARSPERLAALRQHLDTNRATSPLFDRVRYARALESAYASMHARRLSGEPPASFTVPAMAPSGG